MMRIFILLLLALGIAILFTVYPEIISQRLHIEAFGWVFETRQGAFITALVILLGVVWLIRRILSAIVAGPGQLWNTLRLGGKKRREQRLREAIADLLDMRGANSAKAFRKSRGIIPDWGIALLKTLAIPANEQPLPKDIDDPLNTALAARIATDPNAPAKPDASARKAHLEAWMAVHPDAPLAVSRLASISEEEGNWLAAAELLETSWKQGQRSAATVKPRLANVYIKLADSDMGNRQNHLRKAQRLAPDSAEVTLALGRAHISDGSLESAAKLWVDYLEQHNDFIVAAALYELLQDEPLQSFRKYDRKNAATAYKPAMRWVQAMLARDAGLSGLATEIIDELASEDAAPEVLRSCADWHADAGQWQQAVDHYRKLCDQAFAGSRDNIDK